MKNLKKIVCSTLVLTMLISSLGLNQTVYGANTANNENIANKADELGLAEYALENDLILPVLSDGIINGEVTYIDEEITSDMLADLSEDESGEQSIELEDGYVYTSSELEASYNWKKYSNNYFYKTLSKKEKKFYKKLDKVCSKYLNGNGNFKKIMGYNTIGIIKTDVARDANRMSDVISFFVYENPQYYFLTGALLRNSSSCALVCYDKYKKGKTRAKYTEKFREQLDIWVSSVKNNSASNREIVNNIAQLLCDEITYDPEVTAYGTMAPNISYEQSAASAVFEKMTVCAGYTKTFSMLASALGIKNISITSENHAWNGVKVDGKWYMVDTTYADQISYVLESCILTSAAYLNDYSHTPQSRYYKHLPDFSNPYEGGSNISLSGVVIKNSANTVSLSTPDSSQIIFYTVDGSEPSAESNIYQGEFTVETGTVVKAVAATTNYYYTYDEYFNLIAQPYYSFSRRALRQIYPVASPIIKTLGVAKKGINFKWIKVSGANGYEVEYSTSKKFKKAKDKKISKKKSALNIKKAKKGKTYYVRIRAYKNTDNGKVYGNWSKTKKIKLKK